MTPTLGAAVTVPLLPMAHPEPCLPPVWEQDEDAMVIVTQEEGGTAAPPPSCSRNRISTNVLRPPCTSHYDTFLHLLREPRAQGDHGRGCVLRANAAHSHRDREKG